MNNRYNVMRISHISKSNFPQSVTYHTISPPTPQRCNAVDSFSSIPRISPIMSLSEDRAYVWEVTLVVEDELTALCMLC